MTIPTLDIQAIVGEGRNIIGGEFITSKNAATLEIIDPSNQKTLARVARSGPEDVDLAVQAAAAAFLGWRRMAAGTRGQLMRKWAEACARHLEEIAILEAMEVGHPLRESRAFNSTIPATITYHAGAADRIIGETLPQNNPDMMALVFREPYGVCGIIVPWNVPGLLMVRDLAPALAAGNAVVVKPAEDAPLTCMYIVKLALEAGIPPGVINVVNGYGSEAGEALSHHHGIHHMTFTGSPETGSKVMEACAQNLVPLKLELGGKSPQVVFRDANLERAVPAIVSGVIRNAGQVCFAGTRLLVEEPLREKLVDAVATAFKGIRAGAWHQDLDMGPLINARQEQRVLSYLETGQQEGARVVLGGHKMSDQEHAEGFFIEPTIFDGVDPSMRIAKEEIFGPVLSVLSFKDAEEALSTANGTAYGLIASVWTDNIQRAMSLARDIESGQVYINMFYAGGAVGAPFGGYKRSGFGRSSGHDAALDYTQAKSVVINLAT